MQRRINPFRRQIKVSDQTNERPGEPSGSQRLTQDKLVPTSEALKAEDQRNDRIEQLRADGKLPDQRDVMNIATEISRLALGSTFKGPGFLDQAHGGPSATQDFASLADPNVEESLVGNRGIQKGLDALSDDHENLIPKFKKDDAPQQPSRQELPTGGRKEGGFRQRVKDRWRMLRGKETEGTYTDGDRGVMGWLEEQADQSKRDMIVEVSHQLPQLGGDLKREFIGLVHNAGALNDDQAASYKSMIDNNTFGRQASEKVAQKVGDLVGAPDSNLNVKDVTDCLHGLVERDQLRRDMIVEVSHQLPQLGGDLKGLFIELLEHHAGALNRTEAASYKSMINNNTFGRQASEEVAQKVGDLVGAPDSNLNVKDVTDWLNDLVERDRPRQKLIVEVSQQLLKFSANQKRRFIKLVNDVGALNDDQAASYTSMINNNTFGHQASEAVAQKVGYLAGVRNTSWGEEIARYWVREIAKYDPI